MANSAMGSLRTGRAGNKGRPLFKELILSCLCALIVAQSGSAFAQNQPQRVPESVQKYLNVPVWHFNYRVTLRADGGSGNSTASVNRVINGTMLLGLRSQGPSLSTPSIGSLSTPADYDAFIGNYANWISGINIDESKSDQQNEAELMQVLQQNTTAHEQFRGQYRSEFPGVNTESAGPGGFDIYSGHAEGEGDVQYYGNLAFEIDGVKKKYNLLFDPSFGDSMQSLNALTGEDVSLEGTVHEHHQTVEMGLHDAPEEILAMEPPLDNGPMAANIIGDLPASFGNITGQSRHNVRIRYHDVELQGSYVIEYTLSSSPPTLAELIIVPPPDYAKWRPVGGDDEQEAGDRIPVKVKLQKQGGGVPQFKAVRFNFELKNTSREKGVCMNAPRIPAPDNPPDLQFEGDENREADVIGVDRQAASLSGDAMTEGEIVVSSFDYGAFGDLEVTAELENGEVVYGHVRGSASQQLKLPDRNDGSFVAKVFLQNVGNLPDTDDSENDPVGDGYKGDGLSLYEEYRGFKAGGLWIAGDPKKKDVFVFNQMRGLAQVQRGINVFAKATGLVVHRHVLSKQVNDDMVINFNNDPRNHLVDQHVIRIRAGQPLARGALAAFVEEVGTPGTARSVNMPPDWPEFHTVHGRRIPSFERALAHEMSHDVNIYHHGEADTKEWWETDGVLVYAWGFYWDDQGKQWVTVNNSRTIITIKLENGSTVLPERLPIPDHVSIGVPHGQHSGAEECLMRYDIAGAYPSQADPGVRYLPLGEIRGSILDNTVAGTGVNAPGHKPQSRYGEAATPATGGPEVKDKRGNCKHQLRVNDLGPEPER